MNASYLIDKIYCFQCQKTFNWRRSEAPERCMRGHHPWTEPGQFARPDFLLYDGSEENIIACIRVDGPVHDTKRQRTKDKFQAQSFIDAGILVFVLRNEWLLGAEHIIGKKLKKWVPIQFPNFIYGSIALMILKCCEDADLYEEYLSDTEVKFHLGLKRV